MSTLHIYTLHYTIYAHMILYTLKVQNDHNFMNFYVIVKDFYIITCDLQTTKLVMCNIVNYIVNIVIRI